MSALRSATPGGYSVAGQAGQESGRRDGPANPVQETRGCRTGNAGYGEGPPNQIASDLIVSETCFTTVRRTIATQRSIDGSLQVVRANSVPLIR